MKADTPEIVKSIDIALKRILLIQRCSLWVGDDKMTMMFNEFLKTLLMNMDRLSREFGDE